MCKIEFCSFSSIFPKFKKSIKQKNHVSFKDEVFNTGAGGQKANCFKL